MGFSIALSYTVLKYTTSSAFKSQLQKWNRPFFGNKNGIGQRKDATQGGSDGERLACTGRVATQPEKGASPKLLSSKQIAAHVTERRLPQTATPRILPTSVEWVTVVNNLKGEGLSNYLVPKKLRGSRSPAALLSGLR